jgi:hypothetical protein
MKRSLDSHFTRFSVPAPRRAWFAVGPMWAPSGELVGVAITIRNFHAAIHRRLD